MNIAKETLLIEGMHCASCVAAVEKALAAIPGVQSATVNTATETLLVVFDPVSVSQEDCRTAVSNAGYAVADSDVESNMEIESELEKDQRKIDTAKREMWSAWRATIPHGSVGAFRRYRRPRHCVSVCVGISHPHRFDGSLRHGSPKRNPHPSGQSVVAHAKAIGIQVASIEDFEPVTGGMEKLLSEMRIEISPQTVILAAVEEKTVGIIDVADKVAEDGARGSGDKSTRDGTRNDHRRQRTDYSGDSRGSGD